MFVKKSVLSALFVLCLAALNVPLGAWSQEVTLPDSLAPFEELLPELEEIVPAVRDFERHKLDALEEIRVRIHEASAEQDQETMQKLIAEAREELEEVEMLYEAALAHHPESAALHNYYGEFLYDSLAEQGEALEYWQQAKALDDTESRAFNNLGIHYFHSGEYELGLEHLDRALELEPDNPDYLFNMVQMYMIHTPQISELRGWDAQRIFEEAMAMSKQAAQVAPDDFTLQRDYAMNFYNAEQHESTPDWEAAAEAWQAAREAAERPDEVFMTWLNQGRVLIRDAQYEAAIECLDAALDIRPNSYAAKQLLEEARRALE